MQESNRKYSESFNHGVEKRGSDRYCYIEFRFTVDWSWSRGVGAGSMREGIGIKFGDGRIRKGCKPEHSPSYVLQ